MSTNVRKRGPPTANATVPPSATATGKKKKSPQKRRKTSKKKPKKADTATRFTCLPIAPAKGATTTDQGYRALTPAELAKIRKVKALEQRRANAAAAKAKAAPFNTARRLDAIQAQQALRCPTKYGELVHPLAPPPPKLTAKPAAQVGLYARIASNLKPGFCEQGGDAWITAVRGIGGATVIDCRMNSGGDWGQTYKNIPIDRFTIIPIPQHDHLSRRKGRRERISYVPPPLSIPLPSAVPGGLFKQLVHGMRYNMDAGYRRRFLYGEDADGRLTHDEKYALGQEYLRVMDWAASHGKQMKRGAGGEFSEGQQAITAANLATAWGVGKNGPRKYSKARSINHSHFVNPTPSSPPLSLMLPHNNKTLFVYCIHPIINHHKLPHHTLSVYMHAGPDDGQRVGAARPTKDQHSH